MALSHFHHVGECWQKLNNTEQKMQICSSCRIPESLGNLKTSDNTVVLSSIFHAVIIKAVDIFSHQKPNPSAAAAFPRRQNNLNTCGTTSLFSSTPLCYWSWFKLYFSFAGGGKKSDWNTWIWDCNLTVVLMLSDTYPFPTNNKCRMQLINFSVSIIYQCSHSSIKKIQIISLTEYFENNWQLLYIIIYFFLLFAQQTCQAPFSEKKQPG